MRTRLLLVICNAVIAGVCGVTYLLSAVLHFVELRRPYNDGVLLGFGIACLLLLFAALVPKTSKAVLLDYLFIMITLSTGFIVIAYAFFLLTSYHINEYLSALLIGFSLIVLSALLKYSFERFFQFTSK